jgi:branched-chain amino acid transport system ATP-binding protein
MVMETRREHQPGRLPDVAGGRELPANGTVPSGQEGSAEVLQCSGIAVAFAGVRALDGVDLSLEGGGILGLIGTNGAGKTTLVNVLSGYQPPTEGSISLGGRDITGWSPEKLARAGVVRTFQNGRLFPALSVFENVTAAGVGVGLRKRIAHEQARELLEHARMTRRSELVAAALPHGEVRKLGILRALAARPRFILVDEPAAGSNEAESEELLQLLEWIARDRNIGLLVIEHDMSLIMRLCPRIQVLDHGRTIALGPPDEVRADAEVIRAYLGSSAEQSDA